MTFNVFFQTLHILMEEDGDSPVVDVSPFVYVDQLVPSLYTITQVSPVNSAKALLQVNTNIPSILYSVIE